MSQEKKMDAEGRRIINRRPFHLIVAIAAIGAATACGKLAVRQKAASAQTGMLNAESTSSRGGYLYMQTNETKNALIHYRWEASSALTEVERVTTGGAASGLLSPVYHTKRPNAFEGAGSVVLSPVSSPCDGRDEAKLQSAAAEIGGTSGKVRVLAGDFSSPATGAAAHLERAERPFGGLDKFDSGTRWASFTTEVGGR